MQADSRILDFLVAQLLRNVKPKITRRGSAVLRLLISLRNLQNLPVAIGPDAARPKLIERLLTNRGRGPIPVPL